MSTWAYGTVTRLREEPGTAPGPRWPAWIDSALAVVPAEALIVQAVILEACDSTGRNDLGQVTVTLIHPWAAVIGLLALLAASIALYVASRTLAAGGRRWHGPDFLRVLIPPMALLVWTVGMPGSLMDAVWPDRDAGQRFWICLVAGLGLLLLAYLLAPRPGESHQRKPARTAETAPDPLG